VASSTSLKPGDKVTWDTPQGETHGTVVNKETGTAKVKGHTAKAAASHPEYRVKSDKSGKEAIHRPEELRKN
jgi:plastocyanin